MKEQGSRGEINSKFKTCTERLALSEVEGSRSIQNSNILELLPSAN
ncbi:hypothetical protein NSTC731_00371 [Nostoc sp. DSM 114167]